MVVGSKGSVSRRAVLRAVRRGSGALLAAPLGLMACSEEPKPALRVASNQWLGYEPLYIAREHNLFDGTAITLVEFTSASAIMRALRNRNVEVAALTLDEVLLLAGEGLDLVVLWPADASAGGDSLIMHPASFATKLEPGLRIGREAGAVGSYFLARACEIMEVPVNSLTLVSIPAGEHEQAFLEHRVDGIITFEPMRSRLLDNGGREIFSSRNIPNEIVDVLVAPRSVAEKRLGDLRALGHAWFAAVDLISTKDSATMIRLASRQRLSQDDVRSALDGISFPNRREALDMISNPQSGLHQTVHRLGAFVKTHYRHDIALSGDHLLDPSLSAIILGESS